MRSSKAYSTSVDHQSWLRNRWCPINTFETLDQMRAFGGTRRRPETETSIVKAPIARTNAHPRVEIRRVDNQRIAVPVAARVSHPHADLRSCVRPSVQRNNPGLMHHFVAYDDVTRRLHDFDAVVVKEGQHRADSAQRDATVPRSQVRVGVRSVPLLVVSRQTLRFTFLSVWCQRWSAPVGWIDHEGCLPVRPSVLEPAGANLHVLGGAAWGFVAFKKGVRPRDLLSVFLVVQKRAGAKLRVAFEGRLSMFELGQIP